MVKFLFSYLSLFVGNVLTFFSTTLFNDSLLKSSQINLLQKLADKILELHDNFLSKNVSSTIKAAALNDLTQDVYKDSDIPTRLPTDMSFSP